MTAPIVPLADLVAELRAIAPKLDGLYEHLHPSGTCLTAADRLEEMAGEIESLEADLQSWVNWAPIGPPR